MLRRVFFQGSWLAAPRWLGLLAGIAVAASAGESAKPGQLVFVPPPVEGSISLGVYNSGGKIVRILKKVADLDSFKPGSDGLVVEWDRKDQSNKPVAPGKYYARGVMIGEAIEVEGVDYHLNNWVSSDGASRLRNVRSIALMAHGAVVAASEADGLQIVDAKGMTTALPGQAERIRWTGENLLFIRGSEIQSVDPASGKKLAKNSYPNLLDADERAGRRLVLTADGLNVGTAEIQVRDKSIRRCLWLQDFAVLVADDARIWVLQNNEFSEIAGQPGVRVADVVAGVGNVVWMLLVEGEHAFLRKIDVGTRVGRELELPSDLGAARSLAASKEQNELLLLKSDATSDRVIGIRSGDETVWEKWFDRAIQRFRYFDLKDGVVVPSEERTSSPTLLVKSSENPLENGKSASFTLSVAAEEDGVWLSTQDGLPLVPISKAKGANQVKWSADGSTGLHVFVSDGVTVEEFRVSHLDQLYRFDAGAFE